LIILTVASIAHSQAAKSELIGEVRDQNGALVQNAKVSLTEVATGQTSSKVSPDGSFIMTNLKPGIYNVAVEADGFKQSLREGVRLATGERVRLVLNRWTATAWAISQHGIQLPYRRHSDL